MASSYITKSDLSFIKYIMQHRLICKPRCNDIFNNLNQ